MRKLSNMAIVLSLVISLGGHWVVLQSAAWVSMLVTYAQSDAFLVAVSKTFDGAHPCSLCLLVEAGKKAEKASEPDLVKVQKLDWLLERPAVFAFAPPSAALPEAADADPGVRSEPPPLPPPRAA